MKQYDREVRALVEVVDLLCRADVIICEVERRAGESFGIDIAMLREEVRHATSQASVLRAALETNGMSDTEVDDLIADLCEHELGEMENA